MTDIITIQTHDKKFHCDDVAAISLLTNYFGQKGFQVSVLRSRNPQKFLESDLLVDVGGEYDHVRGRFDHHQKSCDERWNEKAKIPLSSVGMVWKHYGKEIVEMYLQSLPSDDQLHYWSNSDEHIEYLVSKIYFTIIQELDANDNGVVMVEGGKRNYYSNLNLPSIVGSCNGDVMNEEEQNKNFDKAVKIVSQIFEIKFRDIIDKYFVYQSDLIEVRKLLQEQEHEQECLILFKPIKTIYKCLNELDPDYRIKFLIFHEEKETTVKTRSRKGEMFKNIVDILPEDTLKKLLTYPEHLIFVHKALFIAKATTLQTAIQIVSLSLKKNKGLFKTLKRIALERPSYTGLMVGGLSLVTGYMYYNHSSE